MPMTPERWKRIDQLDNDTLSQKTEDRPAYLRQRSGDDEDLRQEVESLLEAHDRGGNFSDSAKGRVAALALLTHGFVRPLSFSPVKSKESSPRYASDISFLSVVSYSLERNYFGHPT